jgi:2-haloacid dehalogenase
MSAAVPSAVVFDIGNVFIQWDPRFLYREFFGDDDLLMESFLEEVCSPAWNLEMDRGLPWVEGVARLSQRFPECAELIRAFDERWMEMVPDAVHGSEAVLDELIERGVPVYAITNFSADKFAKTLERFPHLRRFRRTVVSGEVGFVKPEPEIYRLLLDAENLAPGSALFVDDRAANCAGAEAVGMPVHRFRDSLRLRQDLAARGLL